MWCQRVFMSKETTEKEAISRFNEGLLKAVSRAKQLGHAQKSNSWLTIAMRLEEIRVNGMRMATSKPLTRQQVLDLTDRRQKHLMAKTQAEQLH